MENPFQYGNVVQAESFCNRKQELADLTRAMENGERLFVYSERRFGKTSLVLLALEKLPKTQFVGVYVDLWPTDDLNSFTTAMAKAIAEATATTAGKMMEAAKRFFSRLAPSMTVDEEGQTTIHFEMTKDRDPEPELDEVLAAPQKLAKQKNRKVVIILDECQRILEYHGDMVERKLRSAIQHHRNVSYIFLGSRKHLVQEMFLTKSRPLYRAAGHYPLGPIEEKHWLPFIRQRFAASKKTIADEQIRSICRLTEGHPFFTQHLCHVLWEMADSDVAISDELIHKAQRLLLDRESFAYTTLWESLAVNQQRFLKGLAQEASGVKPFASTFTRRYGLRSASNAQRAVDALISREIIDRDNGSFCIADRLLKLWIQQMTLK